MLQTDFDVYCVQINNSQQILAETQFWTMEFDSAAEWVNINNRQIM